MVVGGKIDGNMAVFHEVRVDFSIVEDSMIQLFR